MDSIKVAKVDRVLCSRPNSQAYGTIHLTAHHLIFCYDGDAEPRQEEMWVPYPLISLVTRLPQTLYGAAPLAFRTRTFETFNLTFAREADAVDVFESIKELTVITKVDQLYAFDYQPKPPFDSNEGWSIYSPKEEFIRMGLGSRCKAWRFTDINKDYAFCPTYPAKLIVPARISDTTLAYAAKYRSKARIPALVYLHWANYASITRSSQPMVGLTNNRSIQDEKLIESIFQSHLSAESPFTATTPDPPRSRGPAVYGATATNLIIDARPTTNAMVMSVKGAGTENMEYYKDGKKAYLGVDNIHVMRESLSKVADALRDADQMESLHGKDALPIDGGGSYVDRQALRRSGWLKHISAILDGTLIIVKNIHINSSHVLIHCSDGWDRTAQLSSLSQLCLDPYYRTIKGFEVLVEKDWLSFGHRFADRCGHLSSEKFFTTATGDGQVGGGNADAAHAFLTSMQNKFTPQSHLKETSPVFHQFLECVRQIQRQYPARFEFNQQFLERLHYHLYSCQFGTFLWNNERERRTPETGTVIPMERTKAVWDLFNSSHERPKYLNPDYDTSLDDRTARVPQGDMGVLLLNPKDVRFWNELYGRTDEEMNGRLVTAQAVGVEVIGPVEGTDVDPVQDGLTAMTSFPLPPSPSPSPAPNDTPRHSQQPPIRSQSLSIPPSAGGGVSATLASSLSALPWQSLAGPPPDTSRPPLETSGSAFTLRTTNNTPTGRSRSPLPSSAEENRSANLGVPAFKSMWAQFSSTASAAVTAVQGAYEGAKKEAGGYPYSTGGEMQDKPSSASSSSASAAQGSRRWNEFEVEPSPWASHSRPSPSSITANPWVVEDGPAPSLRASASRSPEKSKLGVGSATQSQLSEFSSLSDPLVTYATTRPTSDGPARVEPLAPSLDALTLSPSQSSSSQSSLARHTSPSDTTSRIEKPVPSPSSLHQPPTAKPPAGPAVDPLGVGFL